MAKRIPKNASGSPNVPLTPEEGKAFGIPSNASSTSKVQMEEEPYVILKYFDPSFECLSSWSQNELQGLADMIANLRRMSWPDIYRTAGSSGTKKGLGYTKHSNSVKLPSNKELQTLSPDLTFFELRVSKKARVHGFRMKSAFFLVWLDRNHKICPM